MAKQLLYTTIQQVSKTAWILSSLIYPVSVFQMECVPLDKRVNIPTIHLDTEINLPFVAFIEAQLQLNNL